MDKVLNTILLSLSVATAYGGVEASNRLKEKERPYCAAKELQVKAIAKNMSAEWNAINAITDAKTMQLHASLQPQQQRQVMHSGQPQQQLPEGQESGAGSQEQVGQAQSQAIATQPVAVQPQQQPTQYVDPKYAWADDLMEYETILIYGAPGSGKTSFSAWLMQERKKRGHSLTILDPHRKYGYWKGLEVVGGGMDYESLSDAIREFNERIVHHYEQFERVPNYNPPRRTTLVEEFTNWAKRCKGSGDFFVTTISDTRKINECVVYVSHSRTMAGLGGGEGFADARDASLLEIELEAQVDPVTKKATSAGRGRLKLPGKDPVPVAIAPWMQGSMDFTDSASPAPQPQQPRTVEVAAEEVGPYAYRYPSNWPEIRSFAQKRTKGQCCFPGCPYPATETHHAQYLSNGFNICDAPRPGEDVFPLCDTHHKDRSNPDCAHHPDNWEYGEIQEPLEIDSRNTPDYHQKLRQGWFEKTSQKLVAA